MFPQGHRSKSITVRYIEKIITREAKGMCEHNNQTCRCRICGGSSFCKHGTRRTRCCKCKGGSICEHGIERHRCKPCKGSRFCMHGVTKRTCRSCEGVDTVRIKCGCGSTVVRGQLNRHDRTKKHQRYLAKHKRWICAAASMAAVVAPAIVPKMAEIAV